MSEIVAARICAHDGWGQYSDETGPCPPPAEMVAVEGGRECPTCGSRLQVFTGDDAMVRALGGRETAVVRNIERR